MRCNSFTIHEVSYGADRNRTQYEFVLAIMSVLKTRITSSKEGSTEGGLLSFVCNLEGEIGKTRRDESCNRES